MDWLRRASIGLAAVLVVETSTAAGQGTVSISGTLVDSATRQPVAGGIIALRSGDKVFNERADEAGAFRFVRIPTGSIVVEVKRIGYGPKSFGLSVDRDTALTVVIVPTARRLVPVNVLGKGEGVFGVIGRSSDIKPIPGAKVLVVGSGLTVTTDSAGEFFVPLKHPGSYLVRVTAEGFGEEVLPIAVKKNEVVESSQLLDASDRKPLSAGLWDDFDQRLRWRPIQSALISGAEIRAAGPDVRTALLYSPSMIRSGLLVTQKPCIFVNGQPRPGMEITDIRVEDIRAIEIYGDAKKDEVYLGPLKEMWPRNMPPCGTGIGGSPVRGGATVQPRGRGPAKVAMMKWVVIWLR
jgi:hypothetical protein